MGNTFSSSSSDNTDEAKEPIPYVGIDSGNASNMQGQMAPLTINMCSPRSLTLETFPMEEKFENLVFRGGGVKGLAYCGAIEVLEKYKMIKNVKRFAGASAGAICATFLALGYSSSELKELLGTNFYTLLINFSKWEVHRYPTLIYNLLNYFGFFETSNFLAWLGKAIEEKAGKGKKDLTFRELYDTTGKELCVIITSLNSQLEEYCHPKTTPDLSIRKAVQISMSIPGLFQTQTVDNDGKLDYYVDGGVTCNYPIHCFDGWFLSMSQEHSFFLKLPRIRELKTILQDRFTPTGDNRTLGFIVYSDEESEIFKPVHELPPPNELPGTKLARSRMENRKHYNAGSKILDAIDVFLEVLKRHNANLDRVLTRDELEATCDDETLTDEQYKIIFGSVPRNAKAVLEAFGKTENDSILARDILKFIKRKTGRSVREWYMGYSRREITGVISFGQTFQSLLLTNIGRIFQQDQDIERTVGISTAYITTTDFDLEDKDKDFLVEQGRKSTEYYLQQQFPKKLN
ncbi:uncharacterized protein LOC125658584 isoform X2 [Ostrea edulis]|uniref:uncharacterized protein LOC125658584 isoform X2 n=1 Tax=Ostrea edulis TaxID=37623 RepID=UPI002095448A|nr:uncharacterized protein LOC125658584 isoform X2 [Ostrea edulis]XP_048745824.1 uncharacterized protein LOC125658584 isoform X2 [Ostrea edulis]XP_056005227.1 uncharacterized protein LOC125658584 isoform X2 [Ostrea edulis]